MAVLNNKAGLGQLPAKAVRVLLRNIGTALAAAVCFFQKKRGPGGPDIFIFFPFYHTGGAERVHADIIACLADFRPRVFITRHSTNTAFKAAFAQHGRLCNISFFCQIPVLGIITTGFLAGLINRARQPIVFGCNWFLFYDMLPLLSQQVKKVDLMHAFGGGAELYSLPFAAWLDSRIVISRKTRDDFARLYAARSIDPSYVDRIHVIENKIAVPADYSKKTFESLRVLYVGRGSEEKRVHLIGKIARKYAAVNPAVSFILVGADLPGSVAPEDRRHCTFAGEITQDQVLNTYYRDAHILLITSNREGLPMALMEAMAHGMVPIATDVGAIGDHVKSGVNGFVISATDEGRLVDDFVLAISRVLENHDAFNNLSYNAYRHALEHFGGAGFCEKYRALLATPKQMSGKS